MRRNVVWYVFAALFLFGMAIPFSQDASANSTVVTMIPNSSEATVAVTVSDAAWNGKEISVICYDPSFQGNATDVSGNRKSVVYMNQFTVNGTLSFSFPVKKPFIQGNYTLVVTSGSGQVMKHFRFSSGQIQSAPPTGTKKPAGKTSTKGTLKAPTGVKVKSIAKGKVRVTWKKVKGAKGYLISTSVKKKGKYKTKLTVKGGSKKKAILKKMKSGKISYIKVRAYKLSGKKKVVGTWSKLKKVKVR